MEQDPFAEAIDAICTADERYAPEAYYFLREALDYTSKLLERPANGPNRHVTGKELLNGLRAYALQEYGPMALTVLRAWGITRTEDFGEIVFHLVEAGRLGRTEKDSKDDFSNGYDFEEAFAKPFLPASPRSSRAGGRGGKRGGRVTRARHGETE